MQKLKIFGLKNPNSLTLKDPKRYGYLNQLEFYVVGVDPHFSRAPPLDRRYSLFLFICEKELGEVKEKFLDVEVSKTFLEKRNEILIKKNEWLTSSLSIFSCGQKSFEMMLANQKCVFDKQRLGFKSSKNQKYFKNYCVKESTSASPSNTFNFCGR